MLNCKNWQNNTAEGCVRAVYSGNPVSIELNTVQPNCMYLLYYMAVNEYPFRPVAAYTVYHESIVTMNWESVLSSKGGMLILALIVILVS